MVTRGHSRSLVDYSWSLVVIRGHSWSLVCTFRHDLILREVKGSLFRRNKNIFKKNALTNDINRKKSSQSWIYKDLNNYKYYRLGLISWIPRIFRGREPERVTFMRRDKGLRPCQFLNIIFFIFLHYLII